MNSRFNWKKIQKYYDKGNSTLKCKEKFKCSTGSICYAQKKGLFKTRTSSESLILYHSNHIVTLSEETKNKISKSRKEYLKRNPDKIPYNLPHWRNKESFAEEYFKELFEKEKIPLKHHLQVGIYQLDFYNLEKGICVEIDGEQHYVVEKNINKDKKRTEYLESLGWKVYRIRWAHYQKLNFNEKKKTINDLKKLLDEYPESCDLIKNFEKPKLFVCNFCKTEFEMQYKVQKFCSIKCYGKGCLRTTKIPCKELLKEIIWIKPNTHIAKEYGVSDKTISKWIKKYNLTKPPRGYWISRKNRIVEN